jgi:hypothetical protein
VRPGLFLVFFFLADPILGPPIPPVVRSGGEPWLQPRGAGGLPWGTTERPADVRATKASRFPDSGFVGSGAEELLVDGPADEERVLRYVAGRLADAWWMCHYAIGPDALARMSKVEWTGAVLGPQDADGWFAIGDATSWDLAERTALLWIDRVGMRQILVSRAKPTDGYAIVRAKPLGTGEPSKKALTACLPGEGHATVDARYDGRGRLVRIRSDVPQPAEEIVGCFAGLLSAGPAEATTSVEVRRKR